jgi:membrane associated rhomboid family serine protease
VVTYALLCANAAAFAWQLAVGLDVSAFRGGAIPFEILTFSDVDLPDVVPPPLTVVTGLFLHAGLLHAASNLLFLWLVGRAVEDALGRRRFAALYAASGIAGALAQIVGAAAGGRGLMVPIIGASGAIAGVLAAWALLARGARRIAVAAIAGWAALQLASAIFGGSPGVAYLAHLGGLVTGGLIARALGPRPAWRERHASG